VAVGDLIDRPAQIEFRGLLLGSGTAYGNVKLDGWGTMPDVRSGNKPRNSGHGSTPGTMFAQERIVTWDFKMWPDRAGFEAACAALEQATAITRGATEFPLVIRTRGPLRYVNARCTKRMLPEDRLFYAGIPEGALQWTASDPRRYDLDESSVTISGPSAGSGGLPYPLAYPLNYGTPGSPSTATAVNEGNAETHPVVVFAGPMTTPRLLNSSLGWAIEFDVDLLLGQTLVVDTWAGTVLLNGTTDRLYTRTGLSVPVRQFFFGPGPNNLTLAPASINGPEAAVTVSWHSAYL
jgi:hypothetical protein